MVEHADLAGSGADVGKKQRLLFKMEVRGDDRLHCKVTETRLVRTGENLDVDSRKEFDAFQEDVRVFRLADGAGCDCAVLLDAVLAHFEAEFLHDLAEHRNRFVADAPGAEDVGAQRNGDFKILYRFVSAAGLVYLDNQQTGGVRPDVDGCEHGFHLRPVPLARSVAPTATAWSPRVEMRISTSAGEIPNRWRLNALLNGIST